jgi:hypothetical protein
VPDPQQAEPQHADPQMNPSPPFSGIPHVPPTAQQLFVGAQVPGEPQVMSFVS